MSISQETNPQENPTFKPAHPQLWIDTKLVLQGQMEAGKQNQDQISKQIGQVEPSKLINSQDMIIKLPGNQWCRKTRSIQSFPDTSTIQYQRPGIKYTVKSHSQYQEPNSIV